MTELKSVFKPTPPQLRFMDSDATVRAYGGALGGGKSRAMCELIFDYALDYPGMTALIARDKHTSIVETTKKTMLSQVIPAGLIVHRKASQGEDFVELFNGSKIHFIGMDDPYRWYSSEISIYALDEAQEINNIDFEKVVRLMTRLRERCADCVAVDQPDCPHMPHKAMMSFNPSNPGHWLKKWFIDGAQRTDYGFRKDQLFLSDDADEPFGSAEFVFALPTDNPYLSQGYLKMLGGLPPHLKRRYLEGKWEFISGLCYFDKDALAHYEELAYNTKPVAVGSTEGDVEEDAVWRRLERRGGARKNPIRFVKGPGNLEIWRYPVEGHRYVMAIDVSSGGSYDYSAIEVVDVEEFEQVAEWQGKADPDLVAREAYRIGRLYNDALAAPEITGGWGFTIDQELKRLKYPRLYTRKVLDRLSKQWTDRTGWDTSQKSRFHMLDTLERVLREKEFGLYSYKAVGELGTFVYTEKERGYSKPEAQPGTNDDLVMALAIAVTVALSSPKQMAKRSTKRHRSFLKLGN